MARLPVNDRTLLLRWLDQLNHLAWLQELTNKQLYEKRVCANHFDPSDVLPFTGAGKLLRDGAIPKLHLSDYPTLSTPSMQSINQDNN